MVGIFKQKNPGNAIVLLVYGLILKFPIFLYPRAALTTAGDNYIYRVLVGFLDPVARNAGVLYSVLAFLLLFTQATLLNRICNSLKMFPRPNYLVAMSFLLVTSLMEEWSYFSAPLLVNSVMIWIWYRLVGLYNSNTPKRSIYNVSVLLGVVPLIYSPAMAFVILLAMALLITRPLRIAEWMVAFLGIITPYYFLVGVLYLTDRLKVSQVLPDIEFFIPGLPASLWLTGAIVLLVVPFVIGGYYVQGNLSKMLIHVRKSWSLLLIFLISALPIIPMDRSHTYLHWLPVAAPIAAFHAATYYFLPGRKVAWLLHWLCFVYAVVINYRVYGFEA